MRKSFRIKRRAVKKQAKRITNYSVSRGGIRL